MVSFQITATEILTERTPAYMADAAFPAFSFIIFPASLSADDFKTILKLFTEFAMPLILPERHLHHIALVISLPFVIWNTDKGVYPPYFRLFYMIKFVFSVCNTQNSCSFSITQTRSMASLVVVSPVFLLLCLCFVGSNSSEYSDKFVA